MTETDSRRVVIQFLIPVLSESDDGSSISLILVVDDSVDAPPPLTFCTTVGLIERWRGSGPSSDVMLRIEAGLYGVAQPNDKGNDIKGKTAPQSRITILVKDSGATNRRILFVIDLYAGVPPIGGQETDA